MQYSDVVIIGGGPAGRVVVHTLHKNGYEGKITLIKDEEINVNRCAVPYGIPHTKPVEKFLIPNALVTDFDAELVVDSVLTLNTKNKTLHTLGHGEFSYGHLVFATGAKPLLPPIPGIEAENVSSVRSRGDMEMLRKRASQQQRALIVGGGYIGIEVAVVLRQLGLTVTVVEMQPHILLATMEDEFAVAIEEHLREKGVQVLAGETVAAFEIENNRAQAVQTTSRKRLDADFFVISVGVAPRIELAEASGIKTSPLGIITDAHLQTSAPDVYACGDCAEKRSFIAGTPTRGEFGTNAVFMAKVVAHNILGQHEEFPGVLNGNVSTAFEYSFGSSGLVEKTAKAAGEEIFSGSAKVMDRYPMMDGVEEVRGKLVFRKKDERLVGGSVLRKGHCTALNIDFITLAIQKGATLTDLLHFQYSTHPELAAKPSDNLYLFAAQDALACRKLEQY